MKTSNIINTIRRRWSALCLLPLAMGFASCADWSDHYDENAGASDTSGLSLYAQIAARPELSDFRRVIDRAHVYANNRPTTLRYSDMLNGSQFYTVFAPKNGSFNCDSLLSMCDTAEGDSLVGTQFLSNHIARYRHSAGSNEQVLMLGGKTQHLAGQYMGGAPIAVANTQASNGILHIMGTDYQYRCNIYEALISLDKYQHIGKFLRGYQITEFDPNSSTEQGVVDGKTVYCDSVFYTYNIILNTIDRIDREDSTFIMFVPSAALWEKIYPKAKERFTYANAGKTDRDQVVADSMQNLYSHYSLIQDLVFNPIWQTSPQDSITTTTWNKMSYPYHVYYKPYDAGGLFSYKTDSTICSNGIIYEMDEWPFDNTMLYFQKIEREAEGLIYDNYETDKKTLSIKRCQITADSVSGGYINVTPVTATDGFYLEYELPNVLRGDYDVKIIYLPKTVYDPTLDPDSKKTADRNAFRPCKFTATITYSGTDGKSYTVDTRAKYVIDPSSPRYYVEDKAGDFIMDCNFDADKDKTRAFITDRYCVDTVQICSFHFPACNYGQSKCTSRLKITNSVTSKENTVTGYSANMLIDKILLIPHNDETY